MKSNLFRFKKPLMKFLKIIISQSHSLKNKNQIDLNINQIDPLWKNLFWRKNQFKITLLMNSLFKEPKMKQEVL